MSDTFRATKGGQLLKSDQFPRVGVIGGPGTELEVATTKMGSRPGTHVVITLLGGDSMAAAGFLPHQVRALAEMLNVAADKVEAAHGRDGSRSVEL
jgi:hypothetical protein